MENQQPEPGATRPSHQPSGIPIARGDAGAPLSAEQQAAEAAALVQFGRNSVPKPRPSSIEIDVSYMSDDELARWTDDDPDVRITHEDAQRFHDRLIVALKAEQQRRAWAWLEFVYSDAIPPDWVTAVAALPLEEEK
ncbi:hypothetical protein [Nonomuraea bangladeshensis]|uniref:hypothetical protein n=1 Tax=Nonomuraea bangladeshensis TaxID=404385 RepID=UPI003C2C4C20